MQTCCLTALKRKSFRTVRTFTCSKLQKCHTTCKSFGNSKLYLICIFQKWWDFSTHIIITSITCFSTNVSQNAVPFHPIPLLEIFSFFKYDISQLKGVILEIGMDQINTRILLDEPNLQNHCFWLRNAKFQKTKIFLTVEWGETVPGLLIPCHDYDSTVVVAKKKFPFSISG